MDISEFLGEFQLEAGEKLDLIASQLLQLERDATNPQPVREMFLAAHTIKGGAAMMRLTQVEALAHAVEDLLSKIRDQHRALDAPTADLLFQAIDKLRSFITEASQESVGVELDAELVAFVEQLRTGTLVAAPAAPALSVPRALVIETSRTVRELHRMLLEDAGYEVETRAEASSGVEMQYSIVVAGIEHGFPLLEGPIKTRVVLTSADADPAMARRAANAGAVALVRKGSLRNSELSAVIGQLQRS
jgi:chemotaxis protein histidine kinase CheA